MLSLSIEKRDSKANLNASRKAGKIPAVFYGRKAKSTPIWLTEKEFIKVWRKAGETSVIELKGTGMDHQALIHEIDADPVSDRIRHADFYVIEKDQKLEISVPLNYIGVSGAVKDLGGILVKVLHELKIEALPKDLPHSIDVDISALAAFDSKIHAKDIKLPAGVELKEKADATVAGVDQPREEKEEEAAPVDLSTIEVEKKGKEPVEGEEGAADAGATKAAPAAKK
jgi:large subunit ribosomal protein L25